MPCIDHCALGVAAEEPKCNIVVGIIVMIVGHWARVTAVNVAAHSKNTEPNPKIYVIV